jgi:hypothetical protein
MATLKPAYSLEDLRFKMLYLTSKTSYDPLYNDLTVPGIIRSNAIMTPLDVNVHDARGREEEFSLDDSGFKFVKYTNAEVNFTDNQAIKEIYYPEIEQLIQKHTGGKQVRITRHAIRQGNDPSRKSQNLVDVYPPTHVIHGDRTLEDSVSYLHQYLGEDAERFFNGRVRIVKAWRPIETVYQEPFALLDCRTMIIERDTVPLRIITTDMIYNVFAGVYHEDHKWYYLKEQAPTEVILFKVFDSCEDVRARSCLHSAFQDCNPTPGLPLRKSIEVVAIVLDEKLP